MCGVCTSPAKTCVHFYGVHVRWIRASEWDPEMAYARWLAHICWRRQIQWAAVGVYAATKSILLNTRAREKYAFWHANYRYKFNRMLILKATMCADYCKATQSMELDHFFARALFLSKLCKYRLESQHPSSNPCRNRELRCFDMACVCVCVVRNEFSFTSDGRLFHDN